MLDIIKDKDIILAIIIRSSYLNEGIQFFTPDNFSQQLAYMNRPKGYIIDPHVHNTVERSVKLTQEVLFVKSGKVLVDFYDQSREYVESTILNKGDVILLASGGHGFEMLESAEIIEVKQGPYAGEADKIRFKRKAEIKTILK
jgi:mannose-6-phosphate isomerase-like protein (cupin superfamily)